MLIPLRSDLDLVNSVVLIISLRMRFGLLFVYDYDDRCGFDYGGFVLCWVACIYLWFSVFVLRAVVAGCLFVGASCCCLCVFYCCRLLLLKALFVFSVLDLQRLVVLLVGD